MAKRRCAHMFASHTIIGDRIVSKHCVVPHCNARLSMGPSNDADVPADEIIAAVCAHSDADHEAYEEPGAFAWDVTKQLAEQWPWNGHPTREASEAHVALGDAMLDEAIAKAEELNALAGPTDQGHPLDGGATGYVGQGQLNALTAMRSPGPSVPLRAELDGGEPFDVGDYAAAQPWVDPGASTRLTDAELVETVAYAPPGSVRDIDSLIERSSVGHGLKNIRENGIDAELAVLDEELRALEQKP